MAGGAGFIGANIVRRLLRDKYAVHVFLQKKFDLWRLNDVCNKIFLHWGDILDYKWVERRFETIKPSYILNLAQYGGYPFQKDVKTIFNVNVYGTLNLLEAAEKVGFEKFIHTGSSSEYGSKTEAMSETDRIEPNTVYGVSKATATLYCAHRGREGKLPVVVLRLFSVYGPWEEPTRLIPTVIRKSLAGESLQLSSPSTVRDFVHTEDIERAYILAMHKDGINGEIINVCSGKQQNLSRVANIIKEVTRSKSEVIWSAYENRSFDGNVWVGKPNLAKNKLGWRAEIDFEDGIKKTVSWFKKYYKI